MQSCFWLLGVVQVSDSNSWLFNHCWLHDHAFMTLCVERKKGYSCSGETHWPDFPVCLSSYLIILPSSVQSACEPFLQLLPWHNRHNVKSSQVLTRDQQWRLGCLLCQTHSLVHLPPGIIIPLNNSASNPSFPVPTDCGVKVHWCDGRDHTMCQWNSGQCSSESRCWTLNSF